MSAISLPAGKPKPSSPAQQGLTPGLRLRGLSQGGVSAHVAIERLIPVNPLPHAVGGDPLRTWPDESTAWEGIQ